MTMDQGWKDELVKVIDQMTDNEGVMTADTLEDWTDEKLDQFFERIDVPGVHDEMAKVVLDILLPGLLVDFLRSFLVEEE